ncbi:MAG: protein kinase [Chloroflexota bacterium]
MASIIGNRYQLGDPLGRGGMGTVYLGTDTQTNTTVAIKRLHPDLANDEQIARFQREGASLRDLDHPNIVKMLDAFQDEGNYYLVMEYVSGGDLKQMIQAGDLGQEQIVRMGIDLADALTRAHKLGIIHRDLKPANVLIADDGTLRLTDFGIAHVRHQATISDPNAVVGTIDYLSPEAISDAEVSESMDIWAFGVMLFQKTGETLFHLSGMDFPDWETPEDAAHYAAVKLFMGSALRARSDFELTTDNLPYIARICRLVQGMPLGIVLAAAWVSVLEPQEIASEINQSIDFLEAEAGDMPSRQQSVRVVMDYAWQMISESDRQGFMGLSVFVGGFSRDAAQAITGVGIRQLMKFVNLSLLRRDADTGRYTIHELLRQYSAEKLDASADIDTIRQKHMRYYADLLTDNYQALIDGRASALHLLNTEFENVKVGWLQAFQLDDIAHNSVQ